MKTTIISNLLGRIQSIEIQEGETIETKVARITQNKEPITDSAPIIFTENRPEKGTVCPLLQNSVTDVLGIS